MGPYALPHLGVENLEGLPMAHSWMNARPQAWIALGCCTQAEWNSSPTRLAAFASCPRVFLYVHFSSKLFHLLPLHAFTFEPALQHKLPSFGHLACCWDPFTRLEMKKDVCLLFPQVYQAINNIPSSVSCSMQDASEVPSAGLSICFPGRHFIWSSIKQSWLSRKFIFWLKSPEVPA